LPALHRRRSNAGADRGAVPQLCFDFNGVAGIWRAILAVEGLGNAP
jgi:hypothetical protein